MSRIQITRMQFKKTGLSFREIADRLGIVPTTINLWIKKGIPITAAYAVEATCGFMVVPADMRYFKGEKYKL